MKALTTLIGALFIGSAIAEVDISCKNFKIQDEDGYAIIRKGPSKESDSIGFLKSDDIILLSDSISSWPYIVSLPIYNPRVFRGHIHRSRLKDAGYIEYHPKWNVRYLCATTITHPEERKQ